MKLKDVIKIVFPATHAAIVNEAENRITQEHKKSQEDLHKFKINWANKSIGTKVIVLINEWTDPIFAIIEDVDTWTALTGTGMAGGEADIVYVCKNVLTGEVLIAPHGTLIPATKEIVMGILELNPHQRWNISTGRRTMLTYSVTRKDNATTDKHILISKLKEVNFI